MPPKAIKDTKTIPLFELADRLVSDTQRIIREAKSEEDLKIGFEKILEPIKTELDIKTTAKYEKSTIYSSARSDAVHGQVIIEYEKPRSFSSKKNIEHAYEQLKEYLSNESKASSLNSLVGVGFDGEKIFFVKRVQNKWIKEPINGAYEFNTDSARTLLIHLRALSRIPLTAENLAKKFGPQSELASKAINAFVNALKNWGNQDRIQTFFN